MDLYRWICRAGFVQLDVQMLYSIKYCVQAGIGWYRLDLPSVGPRGQMDGLKSGIFLPQIVVVKIAETAGDSRG